MSRIRDLDWAMPGLLTKSDFKIARTCPTKLYYRKLKYPATTENYPYLEFLADGGYMVESIAKLMFPDGRRIGRGAEGAEATREALREENVTLFEATLIWNGRIVRVDVLEKRGIYFRLVEVKAKSIDSTEQEGPTPFRGKRGAISAKWKPYLEDVTFQTLVLQRLFPHAEIEPCLCLVDISKTTTIDTIFRNFEFVPRAAGSREPPVVRYTGNLDALRADPFVTVVSVASEVDELRGDAEEAAEIFAESLLEQVVVKLLPEIGLKCRKCEFRVEGGVQSGFRECWGALADPEPHLLDLFRIGNLGIKGQIAMNMIADGKTSLLEVNDAHSTGAYGVRQRLQLTASRAGKEFLSPGLPAILAQLPYPLHFIDFEASTIAVPYHAGMRPYEKVCFQWSCHTLRTLEGDLEHREWLNTEDYFPNFEFARSLREAVGSEGTLLVWSDYEKTSLKQVRGQMARYGERDPELAAWLDDVTRDGGPIVDLCRLCGEHYFHPAMKGSLSIKHVLPAVWGANPALREHPWFAGYLKEGIGGILNPYDTLPALPFGDAEDEEEVDEILESVHEGTGAMRTYQEMLYGVRRDVPEFKSACRQLLLNYCKLDTAAMVMIWMHWSGAARVALSPGRK